MFQFRMAAEHFFVWPALFFGSQPCADPLCPAQHHFVGLAWLVWEGALIWQ